MANYSNLKTAIENAVDWNNGDNEITGQNLLDILETIIDSLGAKYKFADVATPSSSITTPDEPLFYLAGAGTYTNFSGLSVTIPRGTLAIFYYDTAWHYTTVRTDSDAFFNVNQYLEAPSTTYTKANARNAVPAALRSKGMIITYLTTNGWLIEQNLSTSGTWNADANWQTIGPVSVSQNTSTSKTTINIGEESFDVSSFPVSIEQNTEKTTIKFGCFAFETASSGIVNGETIPQISGDDRLVGYLKDDGTWDGRNVAYSLVINISGFSGKHLTITPAYEQAPQTYAFLKNFYKDGVSDFCDDCSIEELYPNDVIIPNDCNFLYIIVPFTATPNLPTISISPIEDGLVNKVATLERKVNKDANILSRLADAVVNKVYTLQGLSSSYIHLNTPISLKENGDSFEVTVITNVSNENSYSFAGKEPNDMRSAIELGTNRIGLRNKAHSWLYNINMQIGNQITYKILFADDKIYSYINGTLIDTQNSQSEISIYNFGDANQGDYGYWAGKILDMKVNGATIDLEMDAQINNVGIKYLKSENNPKMVVEWTGVYWKVYQRVGESNIYTMLEIKHDIDHSDLVYCDLWRLMTRGDVCLYDNGVFESLGIKLLETSENEFAFAYNGAVDFVGGYHGDERIDIDNSCYANFYIDGVLADMTMPFVVNCNSFNYKERSTLHQASETEGVYIENHPIIAYHTKQTFFEGCGYRCINRLDIDLSNSVREYLVTTALFTGLVCMHKDCASVVTTDVGSIITTSGNNTMYKFDGEQGNYPLSITSSYYGYNSIKKMSSDIQSRELTKPSNGHNTLSIWDRTTDTKYYGYAPNRTFVTGDIFMSEINVRWDYKSI